MEKLWYRFRPEYEVSNFGEVRRVAYTKTITTKTGVVRTLNFKERRLKPQYIGKYLGVYLFNAETGKQKWEYIHRLVAQAFLPNPDNLPQVNHKDEDPTNNCVDNLEWCDQTYNLNYGTIKERIRSTNIKRGTWVDYRGKTIGEKEAIQKEKKHNYYLKHYMRKTDHSLVLYRAETLYKKERVFKNYLEAAKYLGVSCTTIRNRIKNNSNKPIKKKYLVQKTDNTLFIEE